MTPSPGLQIDCNQCGLSASAPGGKPSGRSLRVDWKIDIGHIITFCILLLGFAVQYGSLSTRLTVVEAQAAKATATNESLNLTLRSLETTIIRVQTQMDERERRYDAAQSAQNIREDRRDIQRNGIPK